MEDELYIKMAMQYDELYYAVRYYVNKEDSEIIEAKSN